MLQELEKIIKEDKILSTFIDEEVPDRKAGKTIRYKMGSVVEFESFILAAFTKFDAENCAYLSARDYICFWMSFWKNISQIYAGRTINIPLMGAGITYFRDGKPLKQELLEIMLWTLKISGFQCTYADKSINFIIYQPDITDIDFYHTQHNHSFQ